MAPQFGGRSPVDFGDGQKLRISVLIALSADLTADPATWSWTDITAFVRHSDGITVTTGRADESSHVTPGTAQLTLDNRDGRFSRHNATGPYYGSLTRNTPIWITVNPGNVAYTLAQMFVNEWPARTNLGGFDFYVPIRCGGVMRRLGQGSQPALSQLRRGLSADALATTYWPMEDGANAPHFAPQDSGDGKLHFAGSVAPASADMDGPSAAYPGLGGSYPLPVFSTDATANGAVDMPSSAVTSWSVQLACRLQYTLSGTPELLRIITHGSPQVWAIRLEMVGGIPVIGIVGYDWDGNIDAGGGVVHNYRDSDLVSGVDRWAIIRAHVRSDGAGSLYTTVGVVFDNDDGGSVGYEVDTGIIGGVKAIQINAFPAQLTGTAIGHLIVRQDDPFPIRKSQLSAFMGSRLETANDRIARVCGEHGVPVRIDDFGAGTTSAGMGQQPASSVLAILRDAEDADGGVLYETGWGLGYQPLKARYNAPVAMTIDFAALAAPPEPTDDDQGLRNSWTITRTDGTTATVTDDASVAEDGEYAASATLNLFNDDQVVQAAAWRVHMGTDPDLRWPSLSIRFDNTAGRELIEAWTDLQYGARIQVTNPPAEWGTDTIDLFVEGKTERVDGYTWMARLNCSPARPYRVFTLGDTELGRLDTDGSTLTSDITSGETSISVTAERTLWVTSAADFPFDIEIGGERMTVTAIAAPVSDAVTFEYGFEDGDLGDFTTSGDAQWSVQTTTKDTGAYAAQSGDVGDLQYSQMTLRWHAAAAGTIDFRYKVSSESGFDSLYFWLNGVIQDSASGTVDWSDWGPTAFAAGPNVFMWEYWKDETTSSGSDAAWVDNVEITETCVQVFTVTRSVNGVVKAHSAGDKVSLWRPGVMAI